MQVKDKIVTLEELKAGLDKKVDTSDVVNNLTSTATDKPLAAAQGKALNDKIAPALSYSSYTALHLGDFTPIVNGFLMINVWVNANKTFTVKVGATKLFEWFIGSAGNATAQIPLKAGTTVTITTDDSTSSSAEVGKFVAT